MSDFTNPLADQNNIQITSFSQESCGLDLLQVSGTSASGAWPVTNTALYIPFVVYNPFIAVKMSISNGGTASGNFDLGIYDNKGNRLVSKGTTAQSGTAALQTVDITDTTLSPGVYYMACAMDGTTGTSLRIAPDVRWVSAAGILSQTSAFALPSTATFAAAVSAYVPLIQVAGRTTI